MRFDLAGSTQVLGRTPVTLRVLLDGIDESWVRATEGPDTFSPFDVVGHLIDGEETDWMARARIILARGPNLTFTPYDRFRHFKRNAGRSLTSLLDEFARLRAANLAADGARARSSRRASEPRARNAAAATGGVGRTRPGAHRADRACHGQAIPR